MSGEHVCRWCGVALAPPAVVYCSATHQRNQKRWRVKQRDKPLERCPHPEKQVYPTRGLAIAGARRHGAYWYLCRCGVYHMTSKPQINQPERITR